MKNSHRFAVLLLLIIAGSVAFVLTTEQESQLDEERLQSAASPTETAGASAVSAEKSLVRAEQGPVSLPAGLPASLEGTVLPTGWRQLDGQGNLVPTAELRALFEYYLAALGEESLGQLVARIELALAGLSEPARSQARAILGSYLDYKLAVSELEVREQVNSASFDPAELSRRLQAVHDLRRNMMDSRTAEAFFASDEALDRFQIERLQIGRNDDLSPSEKQAEIARAEATLPAPLREARAETAKFQEYQRMRPELSGNPEALQRYREEKFGPEAARKLAEVEASQETWNRRWQAYRADVARIEAAGLAAPEREAAINRLREQHFTGPEKVRAEALDSLE